MKRLVVFASGRGSNAEALYNAMNSGEIAGKIIAVITDKPQAKVLEKAKEWNVPAYVMAPKDYASKDAFEDALLEKLGEFNPDGLILAGYMRLLSAKVVNEYTHKILNIHPALLPSFPGLHAQRQAVEAGVKVSGCTVHFVDAGMDTGPIILQDTVPVYANDTEDTLSARILEKEHKNYVKAVQLFCQDKLEVDGKIVRQK